jgi:hypothetical protein
LPEGLGCCDVVHGVLLHVGHHLDPMADYPARSHAYKGISRGDASAGTATGSTPLTAERSTVGFRGYPKRRRHIHCHRRRFVAFQLALVFAWGHRQQKLAEVASKVGTAGY